MPADVENQTPAAQSQSFTAELPTGKCSNAPFSDGQSAKIWQPYLRIAHQYDNDLVKGWQDDMDTLLIFASLFSASVTPFVIESYHSLQEDSSEIMINVLFQISQQLANGTTPAAARRSSPF
ncbi:hypothetical protein BD410DRAFT_842468 [Rickenella mellea]|uniref:DUF6535 domain-containing protein n=1 Tax=Rickenella mellea TaxID=50990 RepID=A0A4Y7PV14_9AGAM|nr:hypothetical protein BD410DRAFT_842468 [Rickenella mellea]